MLNGVGHGITSFSVSFSVDDNIRREDNVFGYQAIERIH